MAAIKTPPMSSNDTAPAYHVTGPQGNHVSLRQATRSVATPASPNAGPSNFMIISDGVSTVSLSQQNCADLAAPITNFGSTGILS